MNFNQLLHPIRTMVWIQVKIKRRAHTWSIQASARLSSVLAQGQEQVTCGCGGENLSCQTGMTAALAAPTARVQGLRINEAQSKM